MIAGLPLSFAEPMLLLGLLSLPLLWWLLRVMPPRPRRIEFPPTRLLFDIAPKEETPSRTPWWLTALRLLAAALVILAAAGGLSGILRDSGAAQSVETHQGDLRALDFSAGTFSCILAGAVLHHLRDEADWRREFARFHAWLKPGGRLYVADLCTFELPDVQETMWARYGRYLKGLKGPEYRDTVFAYIDKEDSPRSLPFQLELLRASGFSAWDVLHRNSVFACYVAVK